MKGEHTSWTFSSPGRALSLPFAASRARRSARMETVPSESNNELFDDISDLRSLGCVRVSAFASMAIRLATVEPALSSSTHATALSASEFESLSLARDFLDRLFRFLEALLVLEEVETEVDAVVDAQADEADTPVRWECLDVEEFAVEDARVAICSAVDLICYITAEV
jgi:hypothetical protein